MKLNSFLRKSLVILMAMIFLTGLKSKAQNMDDILGQERVNTITTAVPFLMIAPDARSAGMGDVGVSSSPDINSMHWNPAKFAFTEQGMGLSLSYTPWLASLVNDINLAYLSGFYKIDDIQTLGASLRYFSLGYIQFTDIHGNPMGDYRPNEFALDFAYSRKLSEYLSGGIAARFINSNLTQGQNVGVQETRPGRSIAADVSAFYTRELDWRNTPAVFSAGINISNIGQKISYSDDDLFSDFIPINLRFGPTLTLALDEFNTLAFSLDFNKLLVPTPPIYERDEQNRVVLDADNNPVILQGRDPNRSVVGGMFGSFSDAPGGFSEEMREFVIAGGMEYWYDNQFALRGGYFHEAQSKGNRKYFTLGVGLRYNVFGLDFAYLIPVMQRSPLENVLRFTLSFDLDGVSAKK